MTTGTPGTPAGAAGPRSGDWERDGFRVHPAVFPPDGIELLRAEADRVATDAGSACVRHLCRRSGRMAELARSAALAALGVAGLRPVRSILFDKTPEANWPVAWHQDTTLAVSARIPVPGYGPWSVKDGVVHVQPPSGVLERMLTVRIHLDDTPAGNGALRVIPGSHGAGRLDPDAVREWCRRPEIICACAAGDVLLMRPLLLHASSRSERPGRRRVVHFEFAPADALDPRLAWAEPDGAEGAANPGDQRA